MSSIPVCQTVNEERKKGFQMHLVIHLFVWQIFTELLLHTGSHYVTAPNGSCVDPACGCSQSHPDLSNEVWLKNLGAQVVQSAWHYFPMFEGLH